MDDSSPAPASTPAKAQRVLVLQGGGALGSYQAGAYQALCHFDFEPEWIAGISIGAIKSRHEERPRAIAFQRDQRRLDRDLRRSRVFHAAFSAGAAVATGQPAIAKLLRHRAAAKNAGASGRFR